MAAIILGSGNVAAAEEATERPLSIWEQKTFFGDWHGLRTALSNQGVDLTLQYIGEGFGVLSGGIHDRGSYEGRLEFSADVNLEKFMGWRGASTHVTVFNVHDGGWNVADNVGSLADPSNIDAVPTTRLFELWFQQNFFDDRLSIRIGQLGVEAAGCSTVPSAGPVFSRPT